eukprot:CAMPEP_0194347678 /NCGR_PEP_ID=MMETSP0171-20130528/106125_1 /TAXON_ID=218684 /ORGANISM="Corethron pennatum, Strain L29A3" /LENGTH=143 /DNA_ID=CAMNT_0039114961 /DNA_START=233 /DNA_END=664 /DNA_ORIENTATION=+
MVFSDGEVEGFLDVLEGCSEETPVGTFEGYSEKLTEGFMVFSDGEVEGFLDVLEGCSEETPVGTCDGDNEEGPPDIETKTLSTFGPPSVNAVTRTIFIPGLQGATRVLYSQSLKEGVSSKPTLPTTSPFIVTSHKRSSFLPSA